MDAKSQTDRIVLVIAPPGIWRDALVSLVRAQSDFRVIHALDNFPSACARLTEQHADVVIADNGVDENAMPAFIAWLHALDGAVRCVVAVDTQVQQVRCLAAGAHATLLKGWLDEAALRRAIAA